VRLIESKDVEIPVREQIPERGAKDRIVVREAERAALNADDESGGDVDKKEDPLIVGPPEDGGFQFLKWQEGSKRYLRDAN
jgi:hypothetical protein